MLLQAISEPEFYVDLVYKFRKLYENRISILVQLSRYKRKGYKTDIIKQSAYSVVNTITVDYFVYLFHCTQVSRGSDSMKAPT